MRVSTAEAFGAGTWDKISVSIVGTQGETSLLPLDHLGKEFSAGAVSALAGRGRRAGGVKGTGVADTKPPLPTTRRRTSK